MGLTGLEIYKLLPKTNCKDCGYATCLAFAMALAQKKTDVDKCPHMSIEAREKLIASTLPPIRLVTIGTGESKITIGNETVMYRHEEKFYNAPAIGFLIEDIMPESEISAAITSVNSMVFERAGQKMAVNLICVANTSGYRNKFLSAVSIVEASSRVAIALKADDVNIMTEAAQLAKDKRPLIICGDQAPLHAFADIAKSMDLPLAVSCKDLESSRDAVERVLSFGLEDIIINITDENIARRIQDFTYIRRGALKKKFKPFGFPVMAFTESVDSADELMETVLYTAKYAGVIIMKNIQKEYVLPALTARQDIYQDPQKPVQVEPGVYPIGKVTKSSPVLVTTNFSITYFTVASEVEASKVPAYIICCDAEGMSVLTAWAAEKFTEESISEALKKADFKNLVIHRNVIIPGYVAVLSGRLREISGYNISVGPRESSGIVNYLRNWIV